MSSELAKVPASALRWKISTHISSGHAGWRDEWDAMPRHLVAETAKHRSIVMHFTKGVPWKDTPLFTSIYTTRIGQGDEVRGCSTMAELLEQYDTRVDALFADMQAHGFRTDATPIPVYLAEDGELLQGNQGNHRLAMAAVLNIDVIVEIVARHPNAPEYTRLSTPDPDLPASALKIPAMTTLAERQCYYRLARKLSSRGAVVELGAWLGAATAFLAAGVRDSESGRKVQVYDRFVWKPSSHDKKAGGPIGMSQLDAFKKHLGPLIAHVDVHPGEVTNLRWTGGSVSLLVCDAPKRIPEIASVLTAFSGAMHAGSVMAWQDFAYFPSYDIPAAMIQLGDHVEFTEAVYPGTTAVFRVTKPWTAAEVSQKALALNRWSADDVESAWDLWADRLPGSMRPRFACGAAMFLCDLGATDRARKRLSTTVEAHREEVLPKWRYLITDRANLMTRYQPLVEAIRPWL